MVEEPMFPAPLASFNLSVVWHYPDGWVVAASERREGEVTWRQRRYTHCSGSEARQVALEVLLDAFSAYAYPESD